MASKVCFTFPEKASSDSPKLSKESCPVASASASYVPAFVPNNSMIS